MGEPELECGPCHEYVLNVVQGLLPVRYKGRCESPPPLEHELLNRREGNQALSRTVNSSVQLTFGATWRHTVSAGSGPWPASR